MPSPPKPWEVGNANANTAVVTSPSTAASLTTTAATNSAPEVPARSTALTSDSFTTPARPSSYGGYGTTGYGTSAYGSTGYNSFGTGYSSGYGSGYGGVGSYNRFGSSYGGGYGGYGSYGGGYGGYGSYGSPGMNRYGGYGNRFGPPGGPEDMSLTQRMEMGTRSTFEVIESIVGSFGGFAQMLESTFMATHSSFMAMVGVAEQLGFLKNYLGQVFSIFALYRLVKRMIYKVTGRLPPAKAMDLNFADFQQFEQKAAAAAGPKMSRKPLIIFFAMVVGLPYMMHKLIKLIERQQKQQMALQGNNPANPAANPLAGIDPSKLEFARATYDFNAESPTEMALKKGDIVAIISKVDPVTNQPSQWWRGRLRDGTMGMFPANYVEIIHKNGPPADAANNNDNNTNNSAVKDAVDALQQEKKTPAAITTGPDTNTAMPA